ncbi:hypothetical protein RJ640_027617 [Escallonia rubra]|uniref:Cytochrome P450 n=1 Tax=Escallonia rubra TaxID=112253 RepID=A0AA88RDT1_9ASTE|nr:hypothetical protein RJ640_027617 [Escallonia rubra]
MARKRKLPTVVSSDVVSTFSTFEDHYPSSSKATDPAGMQGNKQSRKRRPRKSYAEVQAGDVQECKEKSVSLKVEDTRDTIKETLPPTTSGEGRGAICEKKGSYYSFIIWYRDQDVPLILLVLLGYLMKYHVNRKWSINSLLSFPSIKVRSALFAFNKVVYTANKDKQYRVFKEEVRSLASEVAAKHLAKSSSADQLLGFTASVVHIKTSDDRLNIYGCIMDDKVWEHPKEWRPERFLDENNDSVDLYKMMAFGGGKRVCAVVHSKLYMSISRMAIGRFIQEFDS